jgi:hypothetical protein
LTRYGSGSVVFRDKCPAVSLNLLFLKTAYKKNTPRKRGTKKDAEIASPVINMMAKPVATYFTRLAFVPVPT